MTITSGFRTSAALSLVLAGSLLTGCGDSDGGPAATSITIATNLQLSSLDGTLENLVPINNTIYDPLVSIGADGSIGPGLATAWTSNPDGTQWTFTLREGVTFSDGTPFTSADVVWTYQRVKAETTSMNHSYLAAMTSVSAPGPDTVVFALNRPYAAWPRQTSLIPVVSAKAYQAAGPAAFASRPVGTGPYRVTGFIPNQQVTLAANPHYRGPAPAIPNVTEQQIDTETTRLTGLQSGSVDVALLSPVTADTARADGQLTVQTTPSNLVTYVGFDVRSPGTDQLALRQAVSYAIDRSSIAKALLRGDAEPIGQVLAPSVVGYDPSVQPGAFDPEKARQLVAQSGYDGSPIPFTYPEGPAVPQAAQIAQAIGGYLGTVGIKVALKQEPQATFVTDWFGKRLPGLFLFSIQPSTMDADLVCNLLCTAANTFTDPAVTAAFATQAGQTDPAARKATIRTITDAIGRNMYYAPLVNGQNVYATSRKVIVTPRADGYLLPQFMKPAS